MPSKLFKYKGLICGGRGDKIWDKEFEVEAGSFKQAVDKIYKNLHDGDIVSMEQED